MPLNLRTKSRWIIERLYHVVFGAALVTLITLGAWWTILHWRNIQLRYQNELDSLSLQAQLEVCAQGADLDPSINGGHVLRGMFRLKWRADAAEDRVVVELSPPVKDLVLAMNPDTVAQIERKHNAQLVMVSGEGMLMLSLIFVCILMMYRLLLTEQRTRRDVEHFFQSVSHELKTPIAGVKALMETLHSNPPKGEDLGRFARLGLRETTRLQALVENVLLANRINRQVFAVKPQTLRLVEEARKYIDRWNRVFTHQPVQLSIRCPEDLEAWADPDLLRHTVENLLDNAFKYNPEGTAVSLSLKDGAEWVWVSVEDDGIGLTPEETERIFWRYERGDQTQTKGSGLGLFIARSLVEGFEGRLWAESEGKGKGSRFVIALRKTPGAASEGADSPRRDTPGRSG